MTQLQLPVAPHAVKVEKSRQVPPGQHGWLAEHVWPTAGHVEGWQVPVAESGAMVHPRPAQQSAAAVQPRPCAEHSGGGWQMGAPPSRVEQTPEQHCDAAVHASALAWQVPASVASWHANPLLVARHTEPAQHMALMPASAAIEQPLPRPGQTPEIAQTNAPPSRAARQGAPPQHWSLNWQAWPPAMQQGAVPVKPVGHEPDWPPKHRGMPDVSSLQTSFIPLQQFCEALMAPPSGSTGAPQMFPVALQDVPLSQRLVVGSHETPPGAGGAPQHIRSDRHALPVSLQPVAGEHTVAPEPRLTQVREQQVVPELHGLPSWVQPPPPPPPRFLQKPEPPSVTEQTRPQQSVFLPQTSPLAWQL